MCNVHSKYLQYICWEGISRLPISDLHTCHNVTGSSVVEQWARYPEVAGSILAQFQLFINFKTSWASELTMIVNISFLNSKIYK